MEKKNITPAVPLKSFKRTKILATLGPITNNYEAIKNLINAGANGLRLNFSHGTNPERLEQLKWIRKASKELNKPVAIVQDLQGPKIRLGDFTGEYRVKAGQELRFSYKADFEKSGILPIQYDLSKKLSRGQRMLLFVGRIKTIINSIKDGVIYTSAENDGVLIARKGINIPDTDFGGDILTSKDLADLAFGSISGFDYVAMSFVQSASDIEKLKHYMQKLNYRAKIIAKLETKQAMVNIEEIVCAADMVMVARGDLAPEVSFESVPVYQQKIIDCAAKHAKPVIVATQVLSSMTESPEPTRAEVSDVAAAVTMSTDVIMLSEETSVGQYPIESVKVMKKVIRYVEDNLILKNKLILHELDRTKQSAIASAVVTLAEQINASAIVAETKSGATARLIAARRPHQPIIAVTSDISVANQLALVYGIKSFIRKDSLLQGQKLTQWLQTQAILNRGDILVLASGKYPGVVGTTDTIKVRVLE